MKIHWQPNPFNTTIEIDQHDKDRVVLYLQKEEYTNMLCGLDLWLKGRINTEVTPTIEGIHKRIKSWGDVYDMTSESEDTVTFLSYLDTPHMGDCTCVPCSCTRCQVEDALGVDTLKGLGKHSARKVEGAFGRDGNLSIDEAIANLEMTPNYNKPDTWPDYVGWDVHIPRWEREREAASMWLRKYKEEHGF